MSALAPLLALLALVSGGVAATVIVVVAVLAGFFLTYLGHLKAALYLTFAIFAFMLIVPLL